MIIAIRPLVLTLLIAATGVATAQQVELTITGIRAKKGQIGVGIYTNEKDFSEEKNFITKRFDKSSLANGSLTVVFPLAPGTYGIALIDDENSDRVMNKNFVGLPLEGFGFSNYYHTGFTKPAFEAFRFSLKAGQTQKVQVKIRYM